MSAGRNRSVPSKVSKDDIVIQDAASLLNLPRGAGELTALKTIKNRIKNTAQKSSGNVFDACRTKPPGYLCTFKETQKTFKVQHWFRCNTCFTKSTLGLCTACVNVCHKGHDIHYEGKSGFFCDCGAGKGSSGCLALTGKGETNSLLCTYNETGITNLTRQHFFNCITCGLLHNDGLCTACVNVCHKGHNVRYARFSTKFFCDCGSSGICQALTFKD